MITGRCLCGAVRFEAREPTLFCAHCHCEWCRRAHGAAFVTWLGLAADRFSRVAGDGEIEWFASSPQSQRGFCRRCGTTLFFRSELAAGEMHVALANVDAPEAHPPKAHVFWEAHVPWNAVNDDLPKVGRDAPGLLKYRAVPQKPG